MLTEKKIERFFSDLDKLKLRFPVASIAKATGYSKGNVSDFLGRKKSISEAFIDKFYEEFYSSKNVPQETIVSEPDTPYFKKRLDLKNGGIKQTVPV